MMITPCIRWLAGANGLAVVASAWCATTPSPFVMPQSETRPLPQTSANGRDYLLFVSFPLSYATSDASRKYPVIYLLDAYWDFPQVASDADYVRRDGHAPEALVVGIGYGGTNPDVGLLRQWDLTPGIDAVYDSTGATTGHATEFLNVIANEIIPFVESTYRVDPSLRVLMGNSFGGLFATYAAFARPGLFTGIVASSPRVSWNDNHVFSRAQVVKTSGQTVNTRIFVAWGSLENRQNEEGGSMGGSAREFVAEVAALGIPGLQITAREIIGGGHSGNKPEAFTRGIRYVFAPQAWVPVPGLDPGYGEQGRFLNLSTRGFVGSGEQVLIGGFVVEGIMPKRVLVRAAGPALGPLGVQQPLANPRFRLVDHAGTLVVQNDNWDAAGDGAAITAAEEKVGAFAFNAGSRDAASIVRLAPGSYTVVVESADSTSGIALVEAYELGP